MKEAWFTTTHWSVVLAARDGQPDTAGKALEELARAYWPPLYAFIRRSGYKEAESQDLTQEFFFRLIQRDMLQRLHHQQGRFRSFLLTLLKHFLQEQYGRSKAQKRGGSVTFLSFDVFNGAGYMVEPLDHLSPDKIFERRWAQALFQEVLRRLREEYGALGKVELFDRLKDFQPRRPGGASYAQIGELFGMTEAAVKSAVQRMRHRHREILREEVARTVGRPDEIEEELRHLRKVLIEALD